MPPTPPEPFDVASTRGCRMRSKHMMPLLRLLRGAAWAACGSLFTVLLLTPACAKAPAPAGALSGGAQSVPQGRGTEGPAGGSAGGAARDGRADAGTLELT